MAKAWGAEPFLVADDQDVDGRKEGGQDGLQKWIFAEKVGFKADFWRLPQGVL